MMKRLRRLGMGAIALSGMSITLGLSITACNISRGTTEVASDTPKTRSQPSPSSQRARANSSPSTTRSQPSPSSQRARANSDSKESAYPPLGNAVAKSASYPRQPVKLVEEVEPGSSFFQFREQLRQAVRDRNVQFIRSIVPSGNLPSFSAKPITLDGLDIENPNAPFWAHLEKAIATGCAIFESRGMDLPKKWVCPHVFNLGLDVPDMVMVGENVNVRAKAGTDSPVIGKLSNEAVRLDSKTYEQLPERVKPPEYAEPEWFTLSGWTPIIMPNGQRGYVQNRYVYVTLGYRAVFDQVDGRWQMQVFIAGD
jgi:hypothetical protein